MILVVQLNSEKDSVDVLFDNEGLQYLRSVLNKDWKEPVLGDSEYFDFDHEHFTSKEWGGNELTPEFSSPNSHKIESFKITYVGKNGEKLLSE